MIKNKEIVIPVPGTTADALVVAEGEDYEWGGHFFLRSPSRKKLVSMSATHLELFPANIVQLFRHPRITIVEGEHRLLLENGGWLCCCCQGTYLRVCDEEVNEVAYWESTEWEENAEEVLGAAFHMTQLEIPVMLNTLRKSHVTEDKIWV